MATGAATLDALGVDASFQGAWPDAGSTAWLVDGGQAPGWLRVRVDILPGNATAIERAVAAVDGRLDDVDTDLIRRVRMPAEAPETLLPYLAWERSVDVWDPAWPYPVRLAVVAAAPVVHSRKGTRGGMAAALDALGVATRIVEWWQVEPPAKPYTFEVTAFVRTRLYDGPLLDERLIRVVRETVMRTKPVSRAFDLRVGVGGRSDLGLAPAAVGRSRVDRAAVAASPVPPARAMLGLAPAAAVRNRVALAALAS